MKRYKAHFINLFWHKYYVYLEGRKLGLGMIRLLIHDWDKYGPKMFRAYAENFYNEDGSRRRGEETLAFKETWNRHQKVNKHHWQAHVRMDDDGTIEVMPMNILDIKEMIADWCGARRAYNATEPLSAWYARTAHARRLETETQTIVEILIDYNEEPTEGVEPPTLSLQN